MSSQAAVKEPPSLAIGSIKIPLTIPGTNIAYTDFFAKKQHDSLSTESNHSGTDSSCDEAHANAHTNATANTTETGKSPIKVVNHATPLQRQQIQNTESPGHKRSVSDSRVASSPVASTPNPPQAAPINIFSSFSSFLSNNVLNPIAESAKEISPILGINNNNTPQNIQTITRPNNLPKKSAEEEMKHRKQFEEMMQSYKAKLERDAELVRKKQERKERRERKILEAVEEWKNGGIIENWHTKKNEKHTKQLIWQGIPPNVRGLVWPLAVSNNLQITTDLYEICGQQGRGAAKSKRDSQELSRVGSVALIELDLPRTFPALTIFNKDGPCHQQLLDILEAYACYRPDIGYVQGMSFIAAVLMLYLEPFQAFCCLANLLSRPLFVSFYRMDSNHIQQYVNVFETLLAEKLPKVSVYFKNNSISPLVFIVDWFLTIFSKALPLDVVSRVWDNYFVEGDTFLWRTCFGLLNFHSATLLSNSIDQTLQFLTHLPQDFDQDELFRSIKEINLSSEELLGVLKQNGIGN